MTIKKDSSIKEVVAEHPETIPVFEMFGMGCAGCRAALFESIEQGAEACGAEIESLIERLNSVVAGC
jgi:hybrid cluster-associated redox disulfide protein